MANTIHPMRSAAGGMPGAYTNAWQDKFMLQKKKLPPEKRRKMQIKTYVTEAEFGEIMASSEKAGLSLSEFVRRVCLGSTVKTLENSQQIRNLLKVNADTGRLGGLLKQAIQEGHKEMIYGMLHRIDGMLKELKDKIHAL